MIDFEHSLRRQIEIRKAIASNFIVVPEPQETAKTLSQTPAEVKTVYSDSLDSLTKSMNSEIEKGRGKKAEIGDERTWGGITYIKTAKGSDGWTKKQIGESKPKLENQSKKGPSTPEIKPKLEDSAKEPKREAPKIETKEDQYREGPKQAPKSQVKDEKEHTEKPKEGSRTEQLENQSKEKPKEAPDKEQLENQSKDLVVTTKVEEGKRGTKLTHYYVGDKHIGTHTHGKDIFAKTEQNLRTIQKPAKRMDWDSQAIRKVTGHPDFYAGSSRTHSHHPDLQNEGYDVDNGYTGPSAPSKRSVKEGLEALMKESKESKK